MGEGFSLLLGVAAVFASTAGYMLFLRQKAGLCPEFGPIVTFSSLICLLALAGFAGLLWAGAVVLLAAGLCLLVWQLAAGFRRRSLREIAGAFARPGLLLFVFFSLFMLFYTRGQRLMIGDNFSHWAMMAEYLHRYNALPQGDTLMITYQAYPPGSGLFIYYITLFCGWAESRMMWAQLLLSAAGALCGFAVVRKRFSLGTLLAAASALVMLSGGWSAYDLLVDTLFAAVGFGATAIVLYYRDNPLKAALFSAPVAAASLLIKSSGILFVIANLALLGFLALRHWRTAKPRPKPAGWALFLAAAVLPLLMLWFWNLHVDAAFPAGEVTKHAMRAQNVLQGLGLKNPGELSFIVKEFLRQTVDVTTNRYTAAMLAWNIALGIMIAILYKKDKMRAKTAAKWLLFCDGVLAFYLVALLGMYLTTMPSDEALVLASYHRYYMSVSLYLCGVFTWAVNELWQEAGSLSQKKVAGGLGAVGLAASVLLTSFVSNTYRHRQYHGTLFEVVDTHTAFLADRTDKFSYLVVGPHDIKGGGVSAPTGGYVRYKLWVTAYDVRTPEELAADPALFEKLEQQYTMLLVLEDSDYIRALMQSYPQYAGRDSYVGLYDLPLW